MALDSSLIPPSPITVIDLEAGSTELIQCRICFETEGSARTPDLRARIPYHLCFGRHFIAPCKCKGTSKYVHRECLDNWRAVKVIASLAYLVYLVDGYQQYWLRLVWSFDSELSFYYICGALLFFVLLGLSGCFITCYDGRICNDLAQPCREICLCCCQHGYCRVCADSRMWTDCTACFESCGNMATECGGCMGDAEEGRLPCLFIMALIFLGLFTVFGIFYCVLVATMVGQRIWQRHYHILAKRMLTKEYVVEDIAGEITGSDWSPPSLPPEHVQQLKTLRLLECEGVNLPAEENDRRGNTGTVFGSLVLVREICN
ncbi:uncharacterized protein LOC133290650 isoform X5 [Gastrolobium bilobum]|uniref:uncharacterized protein LOC133290650 isoform X5 n=1 Tax=Gastrolobium bilobum TaxID=150636 RepID=UPI002AB07982|nr:uncharacterized protein LOC133290650 isoform X5 [Gastrolobium bilobum]